MRKGEHDAAPSSGAAARLVYERLSRTFFAQSAIDVASRLLGTIMVRRVGGVLRCARIVETEAYIGTHDLASHASKGRTLRTEVMFGPPGRAYVYFIYGMHWMLNVVTGAEGDAEAVLIRSGEPLDGWEVDLTGPARLAKAFGITSAENGRDVTGDDISFIEDPSYKPRIVRAKRVGVDYARRWKDRLLRFIDAKNPVAKRLKY